MGIDRILSYEKAHHVSMMGRDAVLSDPAICRPSDGDVSSSTGTVVYWIAVPLFGTYYNPEIEAVKRMKGCSARYS
jgi:hypothetical protein